MTIETDAAAISALAEGIADEIQAEHRNALPFALALACGLIIADVARKDPRLLPRDWAKELIDQGILRDRDAPGRGRH